MTVLTPPPRGGVNAYFLTGSFSKKTWLFEAVVFFGQSEDGTEPGCEVSRRVKPAVLRYGSFSPLRCIVCPARTCCNRYRWILYTQNGTFSEFCTCSGILSRHLDRFCSSKRPRGPRGPPELPNDKKTAAPRLLDRLLFRYPPPQIRLKWDVLSVTFNGKFQR